MSTPNNNASPTSDPWVNFNGGINSYSQEDRRKAIKDCRKEGVVRGHYSDMVLDPGADRASNLYPTFDHVECDANDGNMVVETALINRLKTNLPREDFWHVIRHLYWVGVANGHLAESPPQEQRFLKKKQWDKLDEKLKNLKFPTQKSFIDRLRDELKSRSGNVNGHIDDARVGVIMEKLFSEQPELRDYLVDLLYVGREQLVADLLENLNREKSAIENLARANGIPK